MKIENSFEVPVPIEEAWELLTDIERIAPCMPGAELTETVDETHYKGRMAARLGPVALTFDGSMQLEEVDKEGYQTRVKAVGKDTKGRGGAHAAIVFTLKPAEDTTQVSLQTDLQLSGAVAQYGRAVSVISKLASYLIAQFAKCLEAQLSRDHTQNAG